jgi:GntR family transcriptional regulator/MocR family aminotransferase
MSIPAETFFMDENIEGTLQSRLQQIIARGILSGRFRKGEKLPSTRKLAEHLRISRITVTLAYTELQSNDYLASRDRSGYYVSENAPEAPRFTIKESQNPKNPVDWNRAISQRFSGKFLSEKRGDWAGYKYPFVYGQVDANLFDHANWRLCALQALGTKDFRSMTSDFYDQDDPKLIEFVARHTLPRRGILANEDEILITLGAQNALWLSTQILLTKNKKAIIENPCYPALLDILGQSRCQIETVDVDDKGLPPEKLSNDINVIFTTPSHHCPTAATMPLSRRKRLLEKAQRSDGIIIEDDYEFEMSFLQPALPALKSLDNDGRVIYVGSFSKSLFPGMRLGYLVGPAPFIKEARALRASVLRHPPGHIQRTAAYFLSLGHYDALIKRMSKHYEERYLEMEKSLNKCDLKIAGKAQHGGSSFWVEIPEQVSSIRLAEDLLKKDVVIEPGDPFFVGNNYPKNFIRLAYSSIPVERIAPGIELIAKAISDTGPMTV